MRYKSLDVPRLSKFGIHPYEIPKSEGSSHGRPIAYVSERTNGRTDAQKLQSICRSKSNSCHRPRNSPLPVPVKAMAEAKREQRVNRKVFMVVEYSKGCWCILLCVVS